MLYVRNLTQDTSEDTLKDVFEGYGKVERVKKLKDYAFVHFEDRDCAVKVKTVKIKFVMNVNTLEAAYHSNTMYL